MKERLDVLLVKRNLAESREKAKAVIMSGIVYVEGQKEDKAGTTFDESVNIEVRGHTLKYVSRGGLKLEKAMSHFGVMLEGKTCMDVGSSTGGFTDCMLQNGAVKVYAVDVGHGQLAWKLRNDERVVCMEKTNIRYVTPDEIQEKIDFSSIDVSFISLTKVLEPVKRLLKEEGEIVCLIKPQFEAGREKVGKKGVVREKSVHLEVIEMVIAYAVSIGFEVLNLEYSPIKGPEGNIEYLLYLKNHPEGELIPDVPVAPKDIVEAAHQELSEGKYGEVMKEFFIIMNPEKQGAKETAQVIRDYLTSHGASCLIGKGDGRRGGDYHYTDASMVPPETECIITLGGDGTLIQAARDLAGRNIPMLGINRGTLGYLTQISRTEEIDTALDALLADQYQLEERMMLNGRAYSSTGRLYEDIALNEIVITRNERLKMLHFRVYVNHEFLNEYRADGLIAATPTGSTAYNLSAGGPIIVPDSTLMVLTPICSHALNARSIVMSGDARIRIEILGDPGTSQAAVYDGDTAAELHSGDYIEIHRSETKTVLIKLKDVSFLDNLRNKMAGI